jgi:uncharacterized protein
MPPAPSSPGLAAGPVAGREVARFNAVRRCDGPPVEPEDDDGGRNLLRSWSCPDAYAVEPGQDGTASALYTGTVAHRRLRPKPHRLRYRVFSLLLDLDEIPALCTRLRLLSHRRFNLFSFDERDHADGSGTSLREWAERHLARAGIDLQGGPIRLLAMPRVLGYGFNPISVWFCYFRNGTIAALLHEVHNTFGERHTYLIPVAPGGEPRTISQSCIKEFHVSPFMAMDMRYDFRIHLPADRLSLVIRGGDTDGPLIVASVAYRRHELTDAALLRAFVGTPLLTLKVIAGIHWEALRLWIKGIKPHPHPSAPDCRVSIVAQPNSMTAA